MNKPLYLAKQVSYAHFSILRKIIMKQYSGVMTFEGLDGTIGALLFKNGDICIKDRNLALKNFLSKPMSKVVWEDAKVQIVDCPAMDAILSVTNQIHWQETELEIIGAMFSRLPNVTARRVDIRFENFLVNISYDIFLQMADSEDTLHPSIYLLHNDTSNSLLPYRVKVFTFNYLLGYMHSITDIMAKQKEQQTTGFLQRIMNRIIHIKKR